MILGSISVPFKAEQSILITGASGTGKTFFVENLLRKMKSASSFEKTVYVINALNNKTFQTYSDTINDFVPTDFPKSEKPQINLFQEQANFTNPEETITKIINLLDRIVSENGDKPAIIICDETGNASAIVEKLDKINQKQNFSVIVTEQSIKPFAEVIGERIKDYCNIVFGDPFSAMSGSEEVELFKKVGLLAENEDFSFFKECCVGMGMIFLPDSNNTHLPFAAELRSIYSKDGV